MEQVDFTKRDFTLVYKFPEDAVEDYLREEAVPKAELRTADDGIGAYEYWGSPGYDSRPYLEVAGEDSGDVLLFMFLENKIEDDLLQEYNSGLIEDEVTHTEHSGAEEAVFAAKIVGVNQEVDPAGQVRAAIKFKWKVKT